MIIRSYQLIKHRKAPAFTDLSGEEFFTVVKKAFYRNQTVEQVIFPQKVTAIKAQALGNCPNLNTVTLKSQGRIGISTAAMANCPRLEQIENSETVTVIGKNAFQNCFRLKKIALGPALQRIGEGAFRNCRTLTEICLLDGLKNLEKTAFLGCNQLKKVTRVPSDIW